MFTDLDHSWWDPDPRTSTMPWKPLAIANGDGQCGMDCGVAERTCRFVDLPEP
jgi:hypothetical protein